MAAGVDGQAAGVHAHGVPVERRERLFLARQRVVEAHRHVVRDGAAVPAVARRRPAFSRASRIWRVSAAVAGTRRLAELDAIDEWHAAVDGVPRPPRTGLERRAGRQAARARHDAHVSIGHRPGTTSRQAPARPRTARRQASSTSAHARRRPGARRVGRRSPPARRCAIASASHGVGTNAGWLDTVTVELQARAQRGAAASRRSCRRGFYSEIRWNRPRAAAQSASICAAQRIHVRRTSARHAAAARTPPAAAGRRDRRRSRTRASRWSGAWPPPNVGRTPMLVTAGCVTPSTSAQRGVDAVRRQQFVRRLEIRRREPELSSPRVARARRAVDGVVVPEQRRRLVDAPLADQPPDARAADDEVLVADRVDLLGAEAVLRPRAPRSRREIARRGRGRTGSWRRPRPRPHASQSTSTVRTNCSGSHCDSSCVNRTTADAVRRRRARAPRSSAPASSAAAAPCRAGPRAAGAGRR